MSTPYMLSSVPLRASGSLRSAAVLPRATPARPDACRALEAPAQELVSEATELAAELELEGRSRLNKTQLARRLGAIQRARLELAGRDLLDPLDTGLADARARPRQQLDAQLALAETTTSTALALWKNRRSNALEWAIVILIVVDIVFAVGLY